MRLPPRLALQAFLKPRKRHVEHPNTTWIYVILKDVKIYSNFQITTNNLEDTETFETIRSR